MFKAHYLPYSLFFLLFSSVTNSNLYVPMCLKPSGGHLRTCCGFWGGKYWANSDQEESIWLKHEFLEESVSLTSEKQKKQSQVGLHWDHRPTGRSGLYWFSEEATSGGENEGMEQEEEQEEERGSNSYGCNIGYWSFAEDALRLECGIKVLILLR